KFPTLTHAAFCFPCIRGGEGLGLTRVKFAWFGNAPHCAFTAQWNLSIKPHPLPLLQIAEVAGQNLRRGLSPAMLGTGGSKRREGIGDHYLPVHKAELFRRTAPCLTRKGEATG